MNWGDFERACPELAAIARERLSGDELVVIGTIRKDGSPRISPVEPDFVDDELMLGMMWRSRKALDLLRDPRAVVHSVPSDRMNPGGDVKLYGSALDVADPDLRRRYEETIFARVEWKPSEPYHCFVIDIDEAAYVRFEEQTWECWRWNAQRGLRKETKPND
jgi:hypothetical protein